MSLSPGDLVWIGKRPANRWFLYPTEEPTNVAPLVDGRTLAVVLDVQPRGKTGPASDRLCRVVAGGVVGWIEIELLKMVGVP